MSTQKPRKLTLTKAVKYYRAGYPEDSLCTVEFCKRNPVETASIIEEMSSIVYASSLEEACKLAIKYDYGCDVDDDPNNWRSHAACIADIRREAGHYEPDFSAESIVKDLITLVARYNQQQEPTFVTDFLSFLQLDSRIEMAYGRLWEKL